MTEMPSLVSEVSFTADWNYLLLMLGITNILSCWGFPFTCFFPLLSSSLAISAISSLGYEKCDTEAKARRKIKELSGKACCGCSVGDNIRNLLLASSIISFVGLGFNAAGTVLNLSCESYRSYNSPFTRTSVDYQKSHYSHVCDGYFPNMDIVFSVAPSFKGIDQPR